MTNYIQSNQVVLLPDDDVLILSSADSGKIYSIPAITNDLTYRLPSLAPGLHYTFINSTTDATLGSIVVIEPTEVGNNVFGMVMNTPAAVIALNDTEDVEFLAASVTGDYVDCYCDGRQWYVSGMSGVIGLGNA